MCYIRTTVMTLTAYIVHTFSDQSSTLQSQQAATPEELVSGSYYPLGVFNNCVLVRTWKVHSLVARGSVSCWSAGVRAGLSGIVVQKAPYQLTSLVGGVIKLSLESGVFIVVYD